MVEFKPSNVHQGHYVYIDEEDIRLFNVYNRHANAYTKLEVLNTLVTVITKIETLETLKTK